MKRRVIYDTYKKEVISNNVEEQNILNSLFNKKEITPIEIYTFVNLGKFTIVYNISTFESVKFHTKTIEGVDDKEVIEIVKDHNKKQQQFTFTKYLEDLNYV